MDTFDDFSELKSTSQLPSHDLVLSPTGPRRNGTRPQIKKSREKIQNREAILNFFEFVSVRGVMDPGIKPWKKI